jgi:hypothetical protein
MPKIAKNSEKISSSKGKYSGREFGGAKGSARGREIASNSGVRIQVNKTSGGKGKRNA